MSSPLTECARVSSSVPTEGVQSTPICAAAQFFNRLCFESNPVTFFLLLVIPAGPRGRPASSCSPPSGTSSVSWTTWGSANQHRPDNYFPERRHVNQPSTLCVSYRPLHITDCQAFLSQFRFLLLGHAQQIPASQASNLRCQVRSELQFFRVFLTQLPVTMCLILTPAIQPSASLSSYFTGQGPDLTLPFAPVWSSFSSVICAVTCEMTMNPSALPEVTYWCSLIPYVTHTKIFWKLLGRKKKKKKAGSG